jgi:trk system potassium uptake protein TrkH
VRPFAVLHLLSMVLMLFAAYMLLPLGLSLILADGAHWAYLWSVGATLAAGAALWAATRRARRELQVRDGFLLVALVWAVLPAFGTLPLLVQLPGLSFTDAYFEAASGLTASGATVLSGLDYVAPSLNLWRGFMIWLGGMGVIVLAVAIMPLLGVGGSQLFKAETPTPMKDTKLTPRIAETAKGLWLVYFALTVACGLAYYWAGMTGLDALMHAFTTVGLGGFSTHDASYAYWNSPRIEAVAIVFMLLAAINFATHFLAWHRRTLRVYQVDPEAKVFLLVVVASVLGVAAYLVWTQAYPDYATALRFAAFNVVSIATTTGYANTDFNLWPTFAPLWMLFLCSFVSCSGSTGGGMKMIRAQILFKQIFRELLRIIHPRVTNPVKLGGQLVENNVVFAVLAYVFVYVSSIILFTLLLTFSGADVVTAFSAAVVSLNNTGPGLAQVGPASNYAVLNDFQTWVCSFAMLLGRLELFTLLVVLTPAFWRK